MNSQCRNILCCYSRAAQTDRVFPGPPKFGAISISAFVAGSTGNDLRLLHRLVTLLKSRSDSTNSRPCRMAQPIACDAGSVLRGDFGYLGLKMKCWGGRAPWGKIPRIRSE
jgi:hypothetical protein